MRPEAPDQGLPPHSLSQPPSRPSDESPDSDSDTPGQSLPHCRATVAGQPECRARALMPVPAGRSNRSEPPGVAGPGRIDVEEKERIPGHYFNTVAELIRPAQ